MKHYKDPNTNEVYAFAADVSQDGYIPPGLVPISDKERDELLAPTAEELAEKQRAADAAVAKSEVRENGVTRYLTTHTPAEIKDWVAGKLPSLTAPEASFIARLCVALGALYRDQ